MGVRLAVLGMVAILALIRPAQAGVPVDLNLVLAVDVSLSMAEDEAKLQRHGYSAALRDPRVIESIKGGMLGRIAVTYIEWSAVDDQRVLVGWRIISDAASAEAFANELDKAPFKTGTTTSISAGIDFAVRQIANSPGTATRNVIDVSGDGYNDYGRAIRVSRDAAVAAGVVINGLPVMNKRPAWQEAAPPDLDTYYAENVIGGSGSFSLVVKDLKDFGASVLRKLIMEIASRPQPMPGRG